MNEPDMRVHIRRVVVTAGTPAAFDRQLLQAALESAVARRLGPAAESRRSTRRDSHSTAEMIVDQIASHVAGRLGGGGHG